ncbi:MAG: alanine--tRNA ligase [Phycisphaeraceae bacterium]|nr:alanine--tRNA ligase [Phycisphaeraceae bacterium]
MLTSREIRQQYIDYFVKHGHTFVPSSPVVPHGDATLLFANAGMNQFKPYFLGTEKAPYPRAANTQKCIRAGGKHNDLEDVGKDTYHHTFFEMLGNWSFGDYFKKEAITWAWELLTKVWGMDPTRLHSTYFRGDPAEGLEPDDEARKLWLDILPPDHVHPGSKKDNFWEMGDTGPCGPCTEIHIDLTPDKSGSQLVNAGSPKVMEIWNLVFIQFNRAPGSQGNPGQLSPLPARHVDTGMGFERLCSVLQGKTSNYDTDVFTPIFAAIRDVTGTRVYGGKLDDAIDTAYRVIADHIRCLTFALTDGAQITNEGRGYVLRRILRRAVRHGWQTLNVKEPFLCRLVPAVVSAMGDAFPELQKNPTHVAELIREEEESFERTLDRGIALFNEAVNRTIQSSSSSSSSSSEEVRSSISSEDAFKLHDTYGFPLDLTQVMAEERGLTVDVEGFDKLMEQARVISQGSQGQADATASLVDIVQKLAPAATTFLGYHGTEHHGPTPMFLHKLGNNAYTRVARAGKGDELAVILGKTTFYAESGGQVGDTGVIRKADGACFRVRDTVKVGDVFFHLGLVEDGSFETTAPGAEEPTLTLTVDFDRRQCIRSNHTSTHMLNRALRLHVNPAADQKGSLVDDQKLRFDFSHNAAVTSSQIEQVEQTVNADISADLPVNWDYAPIDEAKQISGLRAVFGEKYPPTVRVVSIGPKLNELLARPEDERWKQVSIEFCGGTHLARTGDAEGFIVVSEEAVAKGVRRITALTGKLAHHAAADGERLMVRVEALKNADPAHLPVGIAEVMKDMERLQLPLLAKAQIRDGLTELQKLVKEHEKLKSKEAAGNVVDAARKIAEESDGKLVVAAIDGADGRTLRTAMDVIRKLHPEAALLLGAAADGKVALLASVPASAIAKGLKAGDWVKHVAPIVGGSGGGKPDLAQAGGKDCDKLAEALDAGRQFAQERITA